MMQPQEIRIHIDKVLGMHLDGSRDEYSTNEKLQLLHAALTTPEEHKAFWGYLYRLAYKAFEHPVKRLNHGRSLTPNVFGVVLRAFFSLYDGDIAEAISGLLNQVDGSNKDADAVRTQRSTDFLHELINQGRFDWPDSLITLLEANVTHYRKATQVTVNFASAVTQLSDFLREVRYQQYEAALERMATPEKTADKAQAPTTQANIPTSLLAALSDAHKLLSSSGPFNPKNAGDMIRTCMDEAHRAIVPHIEKKKGVRFGGTSDGERRGFMRDNGFITAPEDKFFSAIYTLISEEASHKLIADKETVLLMHTTVSNYVHLLFRRLTDYMK